MTLRSREPGYELIGAPDDRRGLWMRETLTAIELCAGREGDDAEACLEIGQTIDHAKLVELREVLHVLRYAFEVARDNDGELSRVSLRIRSLERELADLRTAALEAVTCDQLSREGGVDGHRSVRAFDQLERAARGTL